MKQIAFRYYLAFLFLISSIGLNAQSEKIKEGRDFFSNGNYSSAVSLLESITDCPDECKKLLIDAKQCKEWIEKANQDYHATDTVSLKRAIDNYKCESVVETIR
ncbi:hypothetical protein M2132_002430 [Dysgonomonas sp. PH5-45]|uniref:hypothetical protein n=1 Tax=unclassified Dysgonomonas TaxID=2630389 RepID=UPI002474104E|nr:MULTISPECIES: hypothetical protein [unclassified Dysgonomonas]MDH6356072.1 hypothetical protein [Dysgonomonas sp. PH5-45]MDH6388966.1 hypothetical protein [Dysgonomonas sp. PH5-37]